MVRAFLASAIANLVAWTVAPLAGNGPPTPTETIAVVAAHVRIEHRPKPTPTPKPSPTPRPFRPATPRFHPHRSAVPAGPVSPPMLPTIALPANWKTTYMGSARVNDRDVRLWLDWSHQSKEFVPRVFLWHRVIDAMDPREVSLRDAVDGVLEQLKDEGNVEFQIDRPERVCGGRYPGWFLSYNKLDGDPKIHIDDMLLVANNNIYRATYVRTLDEPENPATVAALHSLC
jgi:hypothetical protein